MTPVAGVQGASPSASQPDLWPGVPAAKWRPAGRGRATLLTADYRPAGMGKAPTSALTGPEDLATLSRHRRL